MTGAPMPEGADAVVMVEESRREGDRVNLTPIKAVTPNAGRLTQGREMRQGEVLLTPGTRLDPVKLGLLASVGVAEPMVAPRPIVTIASTGDELVPPDGQQSQGGSHGGSLTRCGS
jgi:molybdopterin molybdotransferase